MSRLDVYQTVTDTVIKALEESLEHNWQLPWHRFSNVPENANTGNFYRGVNIPLLWAYQIEHNYASGKWATYKQWADLGAQVKKGEKGAIIVFWGSFEVESDKEREDPKVIMFPKYSRVFNADQVEGFELIANDQKCELQTIAQADAVIEATGADIRYGGTRAYYNPNEDYINLPCPEYFKEQNGSSATANFYSTTFHELVHYSGAEHRLNRLESHIRFGDPKYAFEEVVAELGAAMCCASLGVSSAVRSDYAQYIKKWLQALKDDKRFIFQASSHAQKAADYIFSFSQPSQAAA